jgi:hypothetical protein
VTPAPASGETSAANGKALAIITHAGLTLKDVLSALVYLDSRPELAREYKDRLTAALKDSRRVGVAYYFGTYRQAGHYFWTEGMGHSRYSGDPPGPWGHVDGQLAPAGDVEGEALLHHKDGWTAIAFANRTDDSRPQSNSAFLFDATLTFDEALEEARKRFSQVVERLSFEIVEVDKPVMRR